MSTGRIDRYGQEAYDEVVRLIGEGVPLATALGGPGKPGRTSFFARLKQDPALAMAYDAAMCVRAQGRISKIEEITDRVLAGKIDPPSAKVAIDSMKWLAQREDPKRFGDRQTTELTGRDGAPLLPDTPKMSDLEMARLLAYLLSKGAKAVPAIDAGDLLVLPNSAESTQ